MKMNFFFFQFYTSGIKNQKTTIICSSELKLLKLNQTTESFSQSLMKHNTYKILGTYHVLRVHVLGLFLQVVGLSHFRGVGKENCYSKIYILLFI
jgi:hypothetical protein